jgi:acetyltransferase-like isoleucine patch superfamily enzyme
MKLAQLVRSILSPCRRLAKDIIYRPRRVKMGERSYIRRPFTLLFPELLEIGNDTNIYSDAYITPLREYAGIKYRPTMAIGNGVYIGRHAYFVSIDSITIGDGCVLSEYVYITDNAHGLHPNKGPIMTQPLESKGPVRIGARCFIGFRVSIMPGVTLGEHCVVGANSVVTHSFPSHSMIAGVPARLVKRYSSELESWLPIDSRRGGE